MGEPIISRELIRRMARAAYERGESRDSCEMKDGAAAKQTWRHEFDRLAAAGKASHASHTAPVARPRIDLIQGAV